MGDRTTRPHTGIRACRIRQSVASFAVLAWLAGAPVLAQTGPTHVDRVIREAVDVLRATELQAAIVRGADDDGPCTILMFNTIHPATGRVHRSRDIYPDLLRWNLRREGVRLRGLMDFLRAAREQHLRAKLDRAPWYRDIEHRRADDDTTT